MLSGIPRPGDPSRTWWQNILRSPFLWATVALLVVGFFALWDMYALVSWDRQVPGGTIPGITNESIILAAKYAWPTAAVWSLMFIWLDRLRKQRMVMWLLAFLWGAAISTWISIYVNSWMAELINIRGDGDPAAGARPAIFVAPFVEEAAKAIILFLLAVLVRYRIVSILQSVTLAGLSAIGFAFTENILYYARAHDFATRTIQAGDPVEAMKELVLLRGVYTSFGHPLFTFMTGVGLAIGLRHRSKLVRVLAPLVGFTLSALGHMAFNGVASTVGSGRQAKMLWFMGLGLVAILIGFLVGQLFRERNRIRNRLTDLARMGWLLPDDPKVYSTLWKRVWMVVIAISQPRRLVPTVLMMRAMTELAYLRDSMTRGLIDDVGYVRARELLVEIRRLRPLAVSNTAGERVVLPDPRRWFRRRQPSLAGGYAAPGQWAPPSTGQAWGPPQSGQWGPGR